MDVQTLFPSSGREGTRFSQETAAMAMRHAPWLPALLKPGVSNGMLIRRYL